MHNPTYLDGVWGVYGFECFGLSILLLIPIEVITMFTTTLKSIKRAFVSAKYFTVKCKVLGEITQAMNGKKVSLPSITISPAGYPVEKLEAPKGAFPMAEARTNIYDPTFKAIVVTDEVWACPSIITFLMHHEDGHLAQMAFKGVGDHTVESSELLADQWAIARCSKEECMAMAFYLAVANKLLGQQLQLAPIREAIRVNFIRIKVLEDLIYA